MQGRIEDISPQHHAQSTEDNLTKPGDSIKKQGIGNKEADVNQGADYDPADTYVVIAGLVLLDISFMAQSVNHNLYQGYKDYY